jgi:hypothetical protein
MKDSYYKAKKAWLRSKGISWYDYYEQQLLKKYLLKPSDHDYKFSRRKDNCN